MKDSIFIDDYAVGTYIPDNPCRRRKLSSFGCNDITFYLAADNDAAAFYITSYGAAYPENKNTFNIHVPGDLAVNTGAAGRGEVPIHNGTLSDKGGDIQFLVFHYLYSLYVFAGLSKSPSGRTGSSIGKMRLFRQMISRLLS